MSSSGFEALNARLLNAGKVKHSEYAEKSKIYGSNSGGNAIIRAQQNSSLYTGHKLATDPLKAQRVAMPINAGKGWFNLQPMELDSKLKQEARMIQMRNYMDPKRFYKNPDKVGAILHTGTVIEGPSEYKSGRLTNQERKQSIADEILADKQIKDYSKRKFLEIQAEKSNKIRAYKSSKKADKHKKLKAMKAKKVRKLF
mmetsp:Transcript_25835/g.43081  ORF Transcript_25835/g.43081 Transcript_25835/m.43081 type:complete len:199 (-) Transcript_25835:2959-3555(-)